uniref:Uncharacterized protein n=1 Tax=Marseillevirus LCMAC101 TaxID=2506602 RepID=A0A481YS22_9VIRU|nr:MAG: hypothetical protein LCMAC101_05730 [Marseillevirus LCMAC101]
MPASTIISEATNVTEEPVILKIEYTCQASEQPQPCGYGSCPAATLPYYNLWTADYSKVRIFYEEHKNLPFCRISAAKNMEHVKPGCTTSWTDYDLLYHRRDGWLDVPVLSPTFV